MKTISVNIPFAGFYESKFSGLIDHECESWLEYAYDSGNESGELQYPEPLRIDESDLGSLLFDNTDYSAGYAMIACDYVEAFDSMLAEQFGINFAAKRTFWSYVDKAFKTEAYRQDTCKMRFEQMTSPREYNFETDRLFVSMPLYILAKIRKAVDTTVLAAAFKERFTSRSGFISHYENTVPDKPLAEWDHNEAGTLIATAIGADFDDWGIYESLADSSYQYFDKAVNWPDLEAAMREKRAELLTDWLEDDPERAENYLANGGDSFGLECDGMAIAYRCTETKDMFDHA